MYNQNELVRSIKAGGKKAEQAYLQLHEDYYGMMHGILLQSFSIQRVDIREELIQETFLKIFKALREGKFRGESSLKNWMMMILKNQAKDYLTKSSTSREKPMDESDVAHWNAQVDEQMPQDDGADCIHEALIAFSKKYTEVFSDFYLMAVNDLSGKELALMLGRSHGATRQYLSSLRKRLRKFIEQYCNEEK